MNLNKLIHLSLRSIYVRPFLNKYRQQYKVASKDSRMPKGLEKKAKINREIWEKNQEVEGALKGKICYDDVYFMSNFETIKYQIDDAIQYFKDVNLDPYLLNTPTARLKVNFGLNMRTIKATKFIGGINAIINFPHQMTFLKEKKVIAFCKSEEQTKIALEAGAFMAGSDELLKMFEKGSINYEEFDCVVCDEDILPNLKKFKLVLRDKIPEKSYNLSQIIGENTDISEIIKLNRTGYDMRSIKEEGINEEAKIDLLIGLIEWPMSHIKENFECAVKTILSKSPNSISGNVIQKIQLSCHPSKENLQIDANELFKKFKTKKDSKRSVIETKKVENVEEVEF